MTESPTLNNRGHPKPRRANANVVRSHAALTQTQSAALWCGQQPPTLHSRGRKPRRANANVVPPRRANANEVHNHAAL